MARLHPEEIPGLMRRLPPVPEGAELMLVVRTGSKAYNLDHAGSDDDLRGIYMLPPSVVLGLEPYPDEVESDEEDNDSKLFELQKFLRLVAKSNPSSLEWLWAQIVYASPKGQILLDNRSMFLSRDLERTLLRSGGNQLKNAHRGSGGRRGIEHFKRPKFKVHVLRMAEQAAELMKTGDLAIHPQDPETLLGYRDLSLSETQEQFDMLQAQVGIASLGTDLPWQVDRERVRLLNKLLLDLPA